MFFGNSHQKQKQQQEREHRRRQNALIEMEDTLGDIMDELGM